VNFEKVNYFTFWIKSEFWKEKKCVKYNVTLQKKTKKHKSKNKNLFWSCIEVYLRASLRCFEVALRFTSKQAQDALRLFRGGPQSKLKTPWACFQVHFKTTQQKNSFICIEVFFYIILIYSCNFWIFSASFQSHEFTWILANSHEFARAHKFTFVLHVGRLFYMLWNQNTVVSYFFVFGKFYVFLEPLAITFIKTWSSQWLIKFFFIFDWFVHTRQRGLTFGQLLSPMYASLCVCPYFVN
jgi:hypothetical protein